MVSYQFALYWCSTTDIWYSSNLNGERPFQGTVLITSWKIPSHHTAGPVSQDHNGTTRIILPSISILRSISQLISNRTILFLVIPERLSLSILKYKKVYWVGEVLFISLTNSPLHWVHSIFSFFFSYFLIFIVSVLSEIAFLRISSMIWGMSSPISGLRSFVKAGFSIIMISIMTIIVIWDAPSQQPLPMFYYGQYSLSCIPILTDRIWY